MTNTTLSRRRFITTALTAAGGLALGIGIEGPAEAASLGVRPWGDEAKRYPGEINASANRNLKENKVYGSLATGGSRAVRETGVMVQQAGASARERLIAAAAKRWNVPASECAAAMSKVTHVPSGRTFRFGELAVEAAAIKLDKEPALKRPDQYKFIGRRLARLDIPLKII